MVRRSSAPALLLLVAYLSAGCASLRSRERLAFGVGLGASAGALGGAALSPNEESRPLNSLVFGLSGALLGGVIALLTDREPEAKPQDQSLRAKELGAASGAATGREFQIPTAQPLPEFLKRRLKLPVIEEYIEQDSVGEDGTLSAPHKVYRIKHPAELIARPDGLETGATP